MENAKNYEKIVSKLVENKKNHFEVGHIKHLPNFVCSTCTWKWQIPGRN